MDGNSEIPSPFFQGASVARKGNRTGDVYPGDREIRSGDELSVQVHMLTLLGADDAPVCERVPALAIKLPTAMGSDMLIQDLPA